MMCMSGQLHEYNIKNMCMSGHIIKEGVTLLFVTKYLHPHHRRLRQLEAIINHSNGEAFL